MKFSVQIFQPPRNPHARCFIEVARGIANALVELGHDAPFDPGDGETLKPSCADGRKIVFNSHNSDGEFPPDTILYNAEQAQETWNGSGYVQLLKRHVVWDYSETNVERLRRMGVERAVLCPIGYYPEATRITKVHDLEDIDVLFIGSINGRRLDVLKEIARRKLRVHVLTSAYGAERDGWIRRAKVVLNLHYYPNPIFEIFRVSHLLANKKCVVSEGGGTDEALEIFAAAATRLVPYEQIPRACEELVADEKQRHKLEETGFEVYSATSQTDNVRLALAKTEAVK